MAVRERITIDLRALGPALRAHAQARNLSVSDTVRLAIAAAVQVPKSGSPVQVCIAPAGAEKGTVKMTIRLRPGVAAHLSAQASGGGLSHGAYVTTLLENTPAPPLAVARILGTSTEQLAVVSADLNELIRTLRREGTSAALVEDRLRPLLRDVHHHVQLASRLMAELRPPRSQTMQAQRRRPDGQGASA